MSELDDKLSAILGNPQMMQQIMNLAQSLGAESPAPKTDAPKEESPQFDPGMLKNLAASGRVDSNQKALLTAMSPYLSPGRVQKLERAMRAAQLAKTASSFLNHGGLSLLTGR